ncbi:unnamed protein product [Lampetra fluviatilis]
MGPANKYAKPPTRTRAGHEQKSDGGRGTAAVHVGDDGCGHAAPSKTGFVLANHLCTSPDRFALSAWRRRRRRTKRGALLTPHPQAPLTMGVVIVARAACHGQTDKTIDPAPRRGLSAGWVLGNGDEEEGRWCSGVARSALNWFGCRPDSPGRQKPPSCEEGDIVALRRCETGQRRAPFLQRPHQSTGVLRRSCDAD